MKLRSVLLAATVLALPAAGAMAQPVNGLYVAGGLGAHWAQHLKVNDLAVGPFTASTSGNGYFDSEGGFVGLGSVGWGFGNGFRVELEGNYRFNSNRLQGISGVNGGADTNVAGLMVNGLYDFNVGWAVTPYVGIGVGYEWTQLSGGHANAFLGNTSVGQNTQVALNLNNTRPGSVATQAILGISYPLPIPGLSLTGEYRFMAAFENQKFNGVASVTTTTRSGSTTGSIKTGNIYDHALLVGLRYAFNAAPPPPPPAPAPVAAPAPAPARTYLVFFDWDKANLTDRARQIIGEAAQNSTRVQVTRIEVDGYADRTGTAAYNMTLSRHRADNVAAELVKDGVPKNIITIQAFGDTHLLVPTAPGVREPQNRRVEIILK